MTKSYSNNAQLMFSEKFISQEKTVVFDDKKEIVEQEKSSKVGFKSQTGDSEVVVSNDVDSSDVIDKVLLLNNFQKEIITECNEIDKDGKIDNQEHNQSELSSLKQSHNDLKDDVNGCEDVLTLDDVDQLLEDRFNKNYIGEQFTIPKIIEKDNCMLCENSLHPVYNKIEELEKECSIFRNTVQLMERQGMEIVRKNNFMSSENKSLKKMNDHLGDLVKKSAINMEIMMQERVSMRTQWEAIIERKTEEITELRAKLQSKNKEEESIGQVVKDGKRKQDMGNIADNDSGFVVLGDDKYEKDTESQFYSNIIRDSNTESNLSGYKKSSATDMDFNTHDDLTDNSNAFESLTSLTTNQPSPTKHKNQSNSNTLYTMEKKLNNLKKYLQANNKDLSQSDKKKVQNEILEMEYKISVFKGNTVTKEYQRNSLQHTTIKKRLQGLAGDSKKRRLKYGGLGNMENHEDGHVNREYCILI